MQATEIGVQLVFDAQVMTPGNVTSLTGATLTLVVVNSSTLARSTYPAIVGPAATINGTVYAAGAYGYYLTLGTEFPTAGPYQLQLVASFNAGAQVFKSPPVSLSVDVAL